MKILLNKKLQANKSYINVYCMPNSGKKLEIFFLSKYISIQTIIFLFRSEPLSIRHHNIKCVYAQRYHWIFQLDDLVLKWGFGGIKGSTKIHNFKWLFLTVHAFAKQLLMKWQHNFFSLHIRVNSFFKTIFVKKIFF